MSDLIEDFDDDELSLLETLDHVLGRGLVISGQITISVAGVDLIYLGLNVLLSSVETIRETLRAREENTMIGGGPDQTPNRNRTP